MHRPQLQLRKIETRHRACREGGGTAHVVVKHGSGNTVPPAIRNNNIYGNILTADLKFLKLEAQHEDRIVLDLGAIGSACGAQTRGCQRTSTRKTSVQQRFRQTDIVYPEVVVPAAAPLAVAAAPCASTKKRAPSDRDSAEPVRRSKFTSQNEKKRRSSGW